MALVDKKKLSLSSTLDHTSTVHVSESIVTLHNVCSKVDLGVKFDSTDFYRFATVCRNVENRADKGKLLITIRIPLASATIYKSGRMIVFGCKSTALNRLAVRRMVWRLVKALPEKGIRIHKFAITNVCASFQPSDPRTSVNLSNFAECERRGGLVDYEPEIKPALTYRMKNPKATFNIFANGKINVVGCASEFDLKHAFENIFPIVNRYKNEIIPGTPMPKSKTSKRKLQDISSSPSHLAQSPQKQETLLPLSQKQETLLPLSQKQEISSNSPSEEEKDFESSSMQMPPLERVTLLQSKEAETLDDWDGFN